MSQRKGPAPRGNQPSPHRANGYQHDSGDYRHQTLTADERREQQLLDELHALGYGITMPCRECGHPLTTIQSLSRHIGPKCAARAKAVTE